MPAEPIVLGSYVTDPTYDRSGRVVGLYPRFEETPAGSAADGGKSWLAVQSEPITVQELAGVWVTVLIHSGGSALVPLGRLSLVEPFALDNTYSPFYFGPALEVASDAR